MCECHGPSKMIPKRKSLVTGTLKSTRCSMIMTVKHISKCGFFQRTHVADTEIKKTNQLINGAAGF